jgi:hypothetical protein
LQSTNSGGTLALAITADAITTDHSNGPSKKKKSGLSSNQRMKTNMRKKKQQLRLLPLTLTKSEATENNEKVVYVKRMVKLSSAAIGNITRRRHIVNLLFKTFHRSYFYKSKTY